MGECFILLFQILVGGRWYFADNIFGRGVILIWKDGEYDYNLHCGMLIYEILNYTIKHLIYSKIN